MSGGRNSGAEGAGVILQMVLRFVFCFQVSWQVTFVVLSVCAEYKSTRGVFANPPVVPNYGGIAASACYALLAIAFRPDYSLLVGRSTSDGSSDSTEAKS